MKRAVILFIALIFGTVSLAADQGKEKDVTEVDETSRKVLKRMYDRVREGSSFKAKMSIRMTYKKGDRSQEENSEFTLAFQKPNQLVRKLNNGRFGSTVVSDGDKVTLYAPVMDRYAVRQDPHSRHEMTEDLQRKVTMYNQTIIYPLLMSDRSFDSIVKQLDGATYVGQKTVDGTKCHHIRVEYNSEQPISEELYIRADGDALPVKVEPDLHKLVHQDAPDSMSIKMTYKFKNWSLDESLPDDLFSVDVPDGASRMNRYLGLPHPLVGTDAPDFTLERLNGETFHLAEHRGKNVVLIEFWATWCPPCRKSLPKLKKVAEQFSDQNLVFVGVNEKESKEKIRSFQEEHDLDFTVALDRDQSVAKKYNARGLPQTVLIDKQGKIQVVHIGYKQDVDKTLPKKIEALLNGEDLHKTNEDQPEEQ